MSDLDYGYLSTLVKQTKLGNSDAFAELYVATYRKQYQSSYKYLRDEYLAQDAMQEVYILALKNIEKLDDERMFISWINQINFRVCFDMAEKYKRTATELEVPEYVVEQVHRPEESPEQRVSDEDEREYIKKKIMELPVKESQAIIMKYYNDMKLEDIAAAMHCNVSSVKRYLAGGRKKLERFLKSN